jgi:hypothetical protein
MWLRSILPILMLLPAIVYTARHEARLAATGSAPPVGIASTVWGDFRPSGNDSRRKDPVKGREDRTTTISHKRNPDEGTRER